MAKDRNASPHRALIEPSFETQNRAIAHSFDSLLLMLNAEHARRVIG